MQLHLHRRKLVVERKQLCGPHGAMPSAPLSLHLHYHQDVTELTAIVRRCATAVRFMRQERYGEVGIST
jgi:hypothetical protein